MTQMKLRMMVAQMVKSMKDLHAKMSLLFVCLSVGMEFKSNQLKNAKIKILKTVMDAQISAKLRKRQKQLRRQFKNLRKLSLLNRQLQAQFQL